MDEKLSVFFNHFSDTIRLIHPCVLGDCCCLKLNICQLVKKFLNKSKKQIFIHMDLVTIRLAWDENQNFHFFFLLMWPLSFQMIASTFPVKRENLVQFFSWFEKRHASRYRGIINFESHTFFIGEKIFCSTSGSKCKTLLLSLLPFNLSWYLNKVLISLIFSWLGLRIVWLVV